MKENEIIDIDGFVHVINKKVICFAPDVLDVDNPKDQDYLIRLSQDLFETELLPAVFGSNTMAVLLKHPCNPYYMISMGELRCLAEDVRAKIRSVIINEEANKESN